MTFISGEAKSASSASDLIGTLRLRAPRIAVALAAGQAAWPVGKALHGKIREGRAYTVKIMSDDDLYDDIHEWVLGLLPQQRSLVARSTENSRSGLASASSEYTPPAPPRIRLRYDGSRPQTITVQGADIRVMVTEQGSGSAEDRRWQRSEIVFIMQSSRAQSVLLDELERIATTKYDTRRVPRFRMLDRWNNWEVLENLAPRTLDSVVLTPGQVERLVSDVSDFLASEQDYARRSIPWHRGHLYEGPPGTGKTSVARALASHFAMDVWYLPLADVNKDSNLLNAISRIQPRSMLLLEDVDVFHAATQRSDDQGVTLSGLLNALDGFATPPGLFTVLTTNDLSKIDPAVIRPGRVGLVEHFGLADADQVSRIMTRWYGLDVPAGLPNSPLVSPSQVVEICRQHDNARGALVALRKERIHR